ncbi:MAG: tetratricopeptide repeat protein, partial [Terriglobales bacterium]
MAFGFGFSKQKALSAAEKFVQQGRLQNAIAEYDKILKNDPNDLTVNNTIGDLYSRLGDSAKAIECFKKVGDAYAAQGFTVKGIAMYKKIAKLQPSVDVSLKLAELYTQQGLFNDARAQYLQVAEDFMKNGELEQAVRLFQKVLEMDPENVPMRVKLGEVYVRLGKKKEAWDLFSAAAESLRSRKSLAAAEDILKRLLALDPGNSYVLLLRGKAALESGDAKTAIENLEKAPDIDSQPDGLRDLLKAHLLIGSMTKAPAIAEKLLTVHNDPEGMFLLAEGYARLGQHREALDIYVRHADRLLATDSTKLLASLHSMIAHLRDDAGALDEMLLLLGKAGESTHVNEVTELLAHASVKDGNLERARDLYRLLATTEPQNPMHLQNCRQVEERLEEASPTAGITAEEGAVLVEELEATTPVIDQFYSEETGVAVRSAVTDADLFLSYNLPEKAVVPLLGALPQAPRDARLNQRLLALHTRYERFTEAAVCCRTLEGVYRDAGYPEEGARYGELAGRYERNAESAPVAGASSIAASTMATPAAGDPPAGERRAASAAAAPWPMAGDSDHETAGAAHPEFAVKEMAVHASSEADDLSSAQDLSSDLSSEWENSLSVDEPAPIVELQADVAGEAGVSDHHEIAETIEEVRFYLEHFMTDQARAGMEKLETLTSDASILDPLRAAVESAAQPAAESEPEIAEIDADAPAAFDVEMETGQEADITTSADPMAGHDGETGDEVHDAAHDGAHDDVPAEPKTAPAYADHFQAEAAVAGVTPAEPAHAEANELTALVADLEAALGDSFPQAAAIGDSPVDERPAVQPLSAQPPATEPASNEAAADSAAPTTLESGPVANITVEAPALPAAMSAMAAAAAGAGATDTPAISYGPAPVRPLGAGAQAMHASDSVDLAEMFGELKRELEEEAVAGDDDPETHYNMGVAFR